jgi:alginate O-acetyltransferase complex protein AlgI
MDITQSIFFIFLTISVTVFYLLPTKFRSVFLILASSIFIATYNIGLIFFLILYICLNYFFLSLLAHVHQHTLKKILLTIAVSINVGILIVSKYLLFIFYNLNHIFLWLHHSPISNQLSIIAPIGISFFTFRVIGLLIDIYRQKHSQIPLSKFILFLTFFPTFLSGPIDRFSNFSDSVISIPSKFSSSNFFHGATRILFGLFKKIVIANNIATLINPVYNHVSSFSGLDLIITAYLFSFQLYFDFSGYSDMAIGMGKIFGFSVPENFNLPYLAISIKEFWQKWHISLSCWFRDYLYIPLGGNRRGFIRQIINFLIVFTITGLWHGASWNFLFWGLAHGLMQVINLLYTKFLAGLSPINNISSKIKKLFGILITFNFVNYSWIFFRTQSFKDAYYFFSHLFSPTTNLFNYHSLTTIVIPIFILYILIFLFQKYPQKLIPKILSFSLLFFGLIFLSQNQSQDFLYFKF